MTRDQSLTRLKQMLADANPPAYVYTPLKSLQFRVLTIYPGQDANSDILKTSLSTYDLKGRKPKWEAISYHWGDSDFSNPVLIDDCPVYINQNAFSALWYLRLPQRKRIVWLDQVCINQRDEEERLQQVTLMGDIFRDAQLVIVYLCDAWPGAEILFRFFDIVGDMPNVWNLAWWCRWQHVPRGSPLQHLFSAETTLPKATLLRLEQLSDHVETIFDNLHRLMSVPYFTRTWIIQEAGLSRKCIIQCSQYTVTWEWLMYLTARAHRNPTALLPYKSGIGSQSMHSIALLRDFYIGRRPSLQSSISNIIGNPKVRGLVTTWREIRFTAEQILKPNRTSLLSIVRRFRQQQSTDGRDKVFGFLGLAHHNQAKDLIAVCDSDVESKQDLCMVSKVVYSFAVWQLESTRTLDVLMGSCYKAKAHADLPHWVPDWSLEPPDCDTEWILSFKTQPHQAGTQHRAEPEFLIGSRALTVRGVALDIVEEVVESFVGLKEWQDPLHETWQQWKDFALKPVDSQVNDPYGDEAGRFEAYWRTLIYDIDGAGNRASGKEFGPAFERWSTGQENYSENAGVTIRGRIVWKTRRLFRTKKGYLGNGCADVGAGDLVCVLHGGRLPFVLRYERDIEGMPVKSAINNRNPEQRQLKGYYLIGGDAYVHGICEGQAWDTALKENIPTQEFALI